MGLDLVPPSLNTSLFITVGPMRQAGVTRRQFKVRMGPGPTFPVGTEIPVIWTISPGFNGQTAPNRRAAMAEHAADEKQEVQQVCSDRHETCTLIFQLFEIYILAD